MAPKKQHIEVCDPTNPLRVDLAIIRECTLLEQALKDPASTDAVKLAAIERYFREMACLAPDQLAAADSKAHATLRGNGASQ